MFFCEALVVSPNCINMKNVVLGKKIRSPRILSQVEGMESLFSRIEFDNAPVRVHLKYATAVSAVVCNTKLLAKPVK